MRFPPRVLLFEIDAVNVIRYYLDVVDWSSFTVTVLMENTSETLMLRDKLRSRGQHIEVIDAQRYRETELRQLIGSQNLVLINGQRIPDTYLTVLSHQEGVPVVYMQHGMYVPFMKRNIGFFFPKLSKTVRYLKMALRTCRIEGGFGMLNEMLNAFLLGKRDHRKYHLYGNSFLPDHALVFSQFWADWHKRHYFHTEYTPFTIIGNPDVDRFPIRQMPDQSCCYCYQTLVEDGRVDRTVIVSMIQELQSLTQRQNWSFSIKSHPRMGAEMRQWVLDNGISLIDNELPLTTVAFGHYSSLLPLWSYRGSVTVMIELPGHEVDESIINCVDDIIQTSGIQHFELSRAEKSVAPDAVNYYYNYDGMTKGGIGDVLTDMLVFSDQELHLRV
jgi:hypothetical protein